MLKRTVDQTSEKRSFELRWPALFCIAALATSGCGDPGSVGVIYDDLRIYSHPYSDVDWANDVRLKGQHHDHTQISPERIRAYDSAGYDAVSLMDYSGNPALAYSLQQRLWPPEAWLSPALLSSFSNIKFFIPNAEEIGDIANHVTSPFMTTYIERQLVGGFGAKQDWQYTSLNEMFELIRENGGLPCRAHAWNSITFYLDHSGVFCVEIYSAFAEARRQQGYSDFIRQDHNQLLLSNWDRGLYFNQTIWGIAVNDHFGPGSDPTVPASIRDSGKVVVVAKAPSLDAYTSAMQRGTFFAVQDLSSLKDQYPTVQDIRTDETSIAIDTAGEVHWIAHGREIHVGPSVHIDSFPQNATYVRAEIHGVDSVIYTQAFSVRPVGDTDGDYDIDQDDDQLCLDLEAEENPEPIQLAACAARDP